MSVQRRQALTNIMTHSLKDLTSTHTANLPRLSLVPHIKKRTVVGHITTSSATGRRSTLADGLLQDEFLQFDQTTAQTLKIASTSTEDDLATGTGGAFSVLIQGIDGNGDEVTLGFGPSINLDGQNPVTIGTDLKAVNRILVLSVDQEGDSNLGTIYVGTGTFTGGKPDTVDSIWNIVAPQAGTSASAFYMVPNTSCWLMNSMSITSTSIIQQDNLVLQVVIQGSPNGATYRRPRLGLIGSTIYQFALPCLPNGAVFSLEIESDKVIECSVALDADLADLAYYTVDFSEF